MTEAVSVLAVLLALGMSVWALLSSTKKRKRRREVEDFHRRVDERRREVAHAEERERLAQKRDLDEAREQPYGPPPTGGWD